MSDQDVTDLPSLLARHRASLVRFFAGQGAALLRHETAEDLAQGAQLRVLEDADVRSETRQCFQCLERRSVRAMVIDNENFKIDIAILIKDRLDSLDNIVTRIIYWNNYT